MKTKRLGDTTVKADGDDVGEVEAVFSTFDVVDSDGDVTLPSAFTDGAPVRISAYGHGSWGGALPVGVGEIRTDPHRAVLHGRFFLNTTAGRDTFEVVKGLADLQEWSYGFDIDEDAVETRDGETVRVLKRVTVHEVSPVMLGAGVGTRTLAVKAAGTDDLRFTDEAALVMASVSRLTDRAADVMAMRREAGKQLGGASTQILTWLATDLERLKSVIGADVVAGDIPDPTDEDGTAEYLRHVLAKIA